jgi:hypothetical protein
MVLRAARRVGFGLLVGAIVLDVLSIELNRMQRFFGARLAYFTDEVLPEPRPLLDVALAVLSAVDVAG